MQMKVSDVLDRWTILKMKALYDQDAKKELAIFSSEVSTIMLSIGGAAVSGSIQQINLLTLVVDLAQANARIWENEAAIRKEFENDPAAGKDLEENLVEIGRRAKAIRGFNKLRVEAKTAIDALFGDIPDRKVQHGSE